jgi:aminoglycoside phosphotransferase (APT) family kinase protein
VREWAAEVTVDEALARRLIGEQFPELELGSLRLLGAGWDTTVWLVDEVLVFRFPRREVVLPGLENEITVLPRLAPLLPLPIPVPTFLGEASDAFGWPFYGAPLLPGREPADARLGDDARLALARPLAEFLRALHSVQLDVDLPVDPVRRSDMAYRVPRTIEQIEEAESLGLWEAPSFVAELLASARDLPVPEPTAITHGDLHFRHLLVGERGHPTAVIDWIDVSRNDPGVDLVLYWCALPPEGRGEFLAAYGSLSEEQLLRARVLALSLCATLAVWGHHEGVENVKREAVDSLERAVAIMPSG